MLQKKENKMLQTNGFITTKKAQSVDISTLHLKESLQPIEILSDSDLLAVPVGDIFFFDVECYQNFFFIAFKHLSSGKFVTFEKSPDFTLNIKKLRWMLFRFCIIGFNSKNYDIPIIELAMTGADNAQLKIASDLIIKGDEQQLKVTAFVFEKKYKIQIGFYNHVDLIEIAPLQGSLKLYAARLHCQRIQDLPFPESHILTQEDAKVTRLYCCNDLNNTELLFKEIAPEIDLRVKMSQEYGVDLRSKSDAQMAEAVINTELKKILGYYPKRPQIQDGLILKYNCPDFITFKTEKLNRVLETIKNVSFSLDANGSPEMPDDLEKLKVSIGKATYKLGMGGLHSMEKKVSHFASDEILIRDNDVASFYPQTILNQKLFPKHLGDAFLHVYDNRLVSPRLAAKAMAKKESDFTISIEWDKKANCFKIVINGSFGKLGSKYSTLYAPQLMLQVTITGQLVLLMLIEMLTEIAIEVISANTDGVILKYHKSTHEAVRATIKKWEEICSYKTEETSYKSVHSRDVNNYIAIKEDGGKAKSKFLDERLGCKTKGAYSERGSALNSVLSRNPENLICIDAVLYYLTKGIPLEKTITECKDFTRFVSVRNVKGGGAKNGKYLGKVVRWYHAKNEAGHIAYIQSGNKVPKTDGAKPAMDLPTSFPDDIDHQWYLNEARKILLDIGMIKQKRSLFD